MKGRVRITTKTIHMFQMKPVKLNASSSSSYKKSSADVSRDWSDHALWWPEKRKWLTHTRSTLDQMGITADSQLEFTPQHKIAR
ncbi:unnamed protein product [Anisakis simplex]|uniref:Kindlin_2_N domain-containing protein n=1 Tax=Anisakis simplex TaxID=6269 RepID=A0A0M3JC14_ANISI|nr:unnamed protein product [Anisakis simplex]